MPRTTYGAWQGDIDRMTPIPVRATPARRSTEQRIRGGALTYCAPPTTPPLTLGPLPEGLEAAAADPMPVFVPRDKTGDDWLDE